MLYPSRSRTKMTWLISICMHGHCGTGAPNFSWIRILCPNFIGMLRSILSMTASNLSDSSMSHGLQMHGGNYRFVESQCSSYFALHFNFSPSRPFQQMALLSVSLCMQTRQSYRHLGLRRATLFSPAVQIYLLSWGTEKMLKGDVWLAGCPSWVYWNLKSL